MRTWMMGISAALAVCAATCYTVSAKEPTPIWDLAKDAFAATTGQIERMNGKVRMDGSNAFAIPNSAIPDALCFTIAMEIRFHELEPHGYLRLLDQRVSDTGFAIDLLNWGPVGSPVSTTINGIAYGQNGFRAAPHQVWQFVFAVRDGAATPYQNNVAGPHYLLRITPNRAPVWVGRTHCRGEQRPIHNYEILSLKVYGPDYKYYLSGESADTLQHGYVGGQGWLVRLPGRTDKPLSRILYYGDSISMGYGNRFTTLMKNKAYCYHWCSFIGNVDYFPTAAFAAAARVAPFDVIIFNNGLHSLHWSPDKVTDAQIKSVFRNMVQAFRKGAPQAKLIWAATTPQTTKGRPVTGMGELNPIVLRINTLAEKVMKEEGVDSVDIYALLKHRLDLAAGDQYHWTGDAYQLIANTLQEKCDAVLARP
jgi:hypothetical protein